MAKKSTSKRANRRSGSVNVRAGGDYVGGDKIGGGKAGRDSLAAGGNIVHVTGRGHTVTGGELGRLFEPVASAIQQQAPPDKLAEAEQKIAELQAQVKAKQPDIGLVGKTLKWLKMNVPGVSSALSTVLSQPIIGQSIKDIAAVILEDE